MPKAATRIKTAEAMSAPVTLNRFQQGCRWALFGILKGMRGCHLTFNEDNMPIASFGEATAALKATIYIYSGAAYPKLLLGGSIKAGESYIEHDWDCDNLTAVIQCFARNMPMLDDIERRFSFITKPFNLINHWKNNNSIAQAKQNILAHYDLGNSLYDAFLDPNMQYSSAVFTSAEMTLEQAQTHKLHIICEKLQLKPTDHLLEIGTGWGGLAVYAAKHFGCKVTTTTISDAQHQWAMEWVAREGLTDKVTLLKQDYRTLSGKYDKLVSIEMIEAVGRKYLKQFFTTCQSHLKPNGLMLLQAITIRDQRYDSYKRSVDFIQKHIFPGGFLPSLDTALNLFSSCTHMQVNDVHDIGLDYAKTLNHWARNVRNSEDYLSQQGFDHRFFRLWKYYLNYCEGAFKERSISTVQILASGPEFYEELAHVR